MAELRFHSNDPSRRVRRAVLDERSGPLVGGFLLAAGLVFVSGLLAAPALVQDLSRSAERLALREEAERGVEAFASVSRRHAKLSRRLSADELFLARVAALAEVAPPNAFPASPPDAEARGVAELEGGVAALARRVRASEAFRKRLAAAAVSDVASLPSRAPVEPSSAVPVAVFGARVSPLTRHPEFFPALLLAAPAGAPVVAPGAGVVVFAGPVPARAGAAWRPLGTVLILAHGGSLRTVYGHLEKTLVRRGQRVRRGDAVARVGQSGLAPAPRLHFELRRLVDGRFVPVDPRRYILDADWVGADEMRAAQHPPPGMDLPATLR